MHRPALDDDGRRLVEALGLEPHPEGGHFRRFHQSQAIVETNGRCRPAMTAIHYLLAAGERSRWHRVDADEAWHWQQGGVLELMQYRVGDDAPRLHRLAPPPMGDGGTCIVPADTWQSATARGAHVLVACTVAPGFVWEGFELLDPDCAVARELQKRGVVAP